MNNDTERERFYSVAPADSGELQRLRDENEKLKEQLDVYTHRDKMLDELFDDTVNELCRPIREPIRATVYEIQRWVEIRFQRAQWGHGPRWYIWNDLTQCEYLGESGKWEPSTPKWFDSPEDAANFWYSTVDKRI